MAVMTRKLWLAAALCLLLCTSKVYSQGMPAAHPDIPPIKSCLLLYESRD